jgi:hypothetical protein
MPGQNRVGEIADLSYTQWVKGFRHIPHIEMAYNGYKVIQDYYPNLFECIGKL